MNRSTDRSIRGVVGKLTPARETAGTPADLVGRVAQSGLEHLLDTQGIGGSNPLVPTIPSGGVGAAAPSSAVASEPLGEQLPGEGTTAALATS